MSLFTCRAYLPLPDALVNICLKSEEGKTHTPQYPGYLSHFKLTVPTGPAAAAAVATPFLPATALAHKSFV